MHTCIFNCKTNNLRLWNIFSHINAHIYLIIVEYIWNKTNAIRKINKRMFLIYFDKKREHKKKIV